MGLPRLWRKSFHAMSKRSFYFTKYPAPFEGVVLVTIKSNRGDVGA